MRVFNNLIHLLTALVLFAALFMARGVPASTDEATDQPAVPAEESGELYLPSNDPMAAVAATLDSAKANNKLALFVMGANWCHDSRALASRLQQEPLSSLVNKHYETLFVDVGFLDKGRNVINSLGPPVYYATPTVLIIDPNSGELVNASNRHQWAGAYDISMEESFAYFQLMAQTDLTSLANKQQGDEKLQALLAEIDAFEQVQADRLYAAYAVLGPMLKAYKDGDEDAFSEDYWNEVRDFRYKVPSDLDALRSEARQRVTVGETQIRFDYPSYKPFSWEQEG